MGFDFLGHIGSLGGGIVKNGLPFLFVLGIIVFFHELGHFLVARWCGIKVVVFSIGFGPELAGFNDRHGTRWKLSAVPLGGYVKFFGDDSAASTPDQATLAGMSEAERQQSFFHQPVRSRAAVVAAGPIANFILAIVIFAGIFTLYGKPSTLARVDEVVAGSAAATAGFQPGDVVVAIDGQPIDSFEDMQRVVSESADRQLEIQVKRGAATTTLQAVPTLNEIKDRFGNVHRIGMLGIKRSEVADVQRQKFDPLTSLRLGAHETWSIIDRTFSFLGGIFVGRGGADQLGGVIRIAQVSGQAWQVGFENDGLAGSLAFVLNLAAILSVSIGLLNLFPVPLLDGGHLLFYAVEAVRGRPLSERAQEVGFRIGFALVLMLMIFTAYNDLQHLLGS
jgi:regulator of sigma E protease